MTLEIDIDKAWVGDHNLFTLQENTAETFVC